MAISTTKRSVTPRKTTASKTSVSKAASMTSAAAKPAPDTSADSLKTADAVATTAGAEITAPEPKLVSQTGMNVSEPDLKKRELIDLVVARSGIKKKDAKPVIEAMLAVLGETIAEGRELNLQPLGKLRINRAVEKGNGRVIICKLRQSLSTPTGPDAGPDAGPDTDSGKDTLAEATE